MLKSHLYGALCHGQLTSHLYGALSCRGQLTSHLHGSLCHGQLTSHLQGALSCHGQLTSHLQGALSCHGQLTSHLHGALCHGHGCWLTDAGRTGLGQYSLLCRSAVAGTEGTYAGRRCPALSADSLTGVQADTGRVRSCTAGVLSALGLPPPGGIGPAANVTAGPAGLLELGHGHRQPGSAPRKDQTLGGGSVVAQLVVTRRRF